MEVVLLHQVARAAVQREARALREGAGQAVHVEVVARHGDVVVAGNGYSRSVVAELRLVNQHIVGVARGAGGDGRQKAAELAVRGLVHGALADGRRFHQHGVAQGGHAESRVYGLDGVALVEGHGGGGVGEGAAFEGDAFHVPEGDMGVEGGVVGGEEVVVIHGEGAVGEAAEVVADGGAADDIRIGEELHGLAVVVERAVGALDDAAGGVPVVAWRARADAAQCVLYHGPVAQNHSALVGFCLVQIAVALHEDALPHFARAG